MSSAASKYIIISVVISLVVGFIGGYYYRNLNAESPVTVSAPSPQSTSGQVGSREKTLNNIFGFAIDRAIRQEIAEKGIEKVFGTAATVAAINPSIIRRAEQFITPTARAQALPGCSGADLSGIVAATTALIEIEYDAMNKCDREMTIKGTLKVTVYHGTDDFTGKKTVGWDWVFDGNGTYKAYNPDLCTDYDGKISSVHAEGGGGEHSDNEKAVCSSSIPFEHTFINRGFDCPCKNKPGLTPTPEQTTPSTTVN